MEWEHQIVLIILVTAFCEHHHFVEHIVILCIRNYSFLLVYYVGIEGETYFVMPSKNLGMYFRLHLRYLWILHLAQLGLFNQEPTTIDYNIDARSYAYIDLNTTRTDWCLQVNLFFFMWLLISSTMTSLSLFNLAI